MEERLQKKFKKEILLAKIKRKVKALVSSHIFLKQETLPLKATADE